MRVPGGRIRHVSLLCLVAGALHARVNVTTYHNDARTGQNTRETILTPANVNSTQFREVVFPLRWMALFMLAHSISRGHHRRSLGAHNVVCNSPPEHDGVYAIDADTGGIYSHVGLIAPGGTTPRSLTNLGCGDLVPEAGVTGTPVIWILPQALYVVAKSLVGGNGRAVLARAGCREPERNSAARLSSGAPWWVRRPMEMAAPWPSTQPGSIKGLLCLLENGHVVIGWGSHCTTIRHITAGSCPWSRLPRC